MSRQVTVSPEHVFRTMRKIVVNPTDFTGPWAILTRFANDRLWTVWGGMRREADNGSADVYICARTKAEALEQAIKWTKYGRV